MECNPEQPALENGDKQTNSCLQLKLIHKLDPDINKLFKRYLYINMANSAVIERLRVID
jgi:hypothetical protein